MPMSVDGNSMATEDEKRLQTVSPGDTIYPISHVHLTLNDIILAM